MNTHITMFYGSSNTNGLAPWLPALQNLLLEDPACRVQGFVCRASGST